MEKNNSLNSEIVRNAIHLFIAMLLFCYFSVFFDKVTIILFGVAGLGIICLFAIEFYS